jgi:hypothetical protein
MASPRIKELTLLLKMRHDSNTHGYGFETGELEFDTGFFVNDFVILPACFWASDEE